MPIRFSQLLLFSLVFLLALPPVSAQKAPAVPGGDVFVDKAGVLRWQKTKQEVALFGVNYTTPFAYAYRAHQRLGVPHEQAIRQDVYHLSRLGVDAFRVHVWDVEITDTAGNLLENEHLRLLDFLVNELKQRGIKIILTPIAYWNNGYPEHDSGTGFSSIYSKGAAYTNPRAIAAQERYLTQFLNHRNAYTKNLNREDPDILAFEVCNEPKYHLPEAPITNFADRMAGAIRATGCRKPVFYNVSENPDVYAAILNAKVDGLTFQWYPQGLVAGHTLRGNFLPYVDQYPIPFSGDARFKAKAKMVYEFESPDILQPIMYPFMARSFRTAGFQWATQFAYDPLALAYANTEYQTHYLNLAYTPAKALSLLIAGKVFRTVKRGQQFGRYPQDSVFGDFHISYRQQLSELNAPTEFYYTANTSTAPQQPAKLVHLAGVGSSKVVRYGGTGAYFLDKLAPGVWRLEVMPDAVAIRDPFEKASPSKPVTQILWNEQPLEVALPDLGRSFSLRALNEHNSYEAHTTDGRITVRPGVYLVAASGKSTLPFTPRTEFNHGELRDFAAPIGFALLEGAQQQVRHTAPAQASAGQPLRISATISGPADSVFLVAQHYYGQTRTVPMTTRSYASWEATVPAELLYPGQLRYWLVAKKGAQTLTFPGGFAGQPRDWDFAHAEHYEVPIVEAGAPLPLYRADRDQERIEARGLAPNTWTDYVPAPDGTLALRLVQGPARAGQPATSGPAVSLRAFFGDRLVGRSEDLGRFTQVVVRARTSQPDAKLSLQLTTKDAVSYAAPVAVAAGAALQEVVVPLSAFRAAPGLLVPRPYPGFGPLTYQPATSPPLKLADAEVLQLVWEAASVTGSPASVDVESVVLR